MNRIDFTKQGGFPFTQDVTDFMQTDYVRSLNALAAAWAKAQGGQYVILSGCEQNGNTVASGICSVNGELIYCPGGSGTTVKIVETSQSVAFEDGSTHPVYFTRVLMFASDGNIQWSEFLRIPKMATAAQGAKADTALQSAATEPVSIEFTSPSDNPRYLHYRKNELGQLEIKGGLYFMIGVSREVLFTLPAGLRPAYKASVVTEWYKNDNGDVVIMGFDIDPSTGEVRQKKVNAPNVLNVPRSGEVSVVIPL